MPLLATIGEGAARAYGAYGRGGTAQASFSGTISTNQTNLNLRTWALANGWNGTTAATVTVGAGVYVYSTSTATPGMTIDGSWPGGITLINNGYIMGMGGKGGGLQNTVPATNGGNAISLGVNVSIQNNSYIGGGGGGGAGGDGGRGAGGGAGGGNGGDGQSTGSNSSSVGGAGGGPGLSGTTAATAGPALYVNSGGGGGGRIMPGTGGSGGIANQNSSSSTCTGGGGGGSGGGSGAYADGYYGVNRNGFSGGSAGSAGTNADYLGVGVWNSGGGGGWGASGGTAGTTSGGTGGKAIALNGFTATLSGSGTRYGATS